MTRKCDFCDKPAVYDAKTSLGPWANLCESDYTMYGATEKGLFSRLDRPTPTREDRAADLNAALDAGDFDAAMDAIGDGDIFDYL